MPKLAKTDNSGEDGQTDPIDAKPGKYQKWRELNVILAALNKELVRYARPCARVGLYVSLSF